MLSSAQIRNTFSVKSSDPDIPQAACSVRQLENHEVANALFISLGDQVGDEAGSFGRNRPRDWQPRTQSPGLYHARRAIPAEKIRSFMAC
jgi:hypothetical protein